MRGSRRHTWLFTFVDIAFLLLMVFTQFARMGRADLPVAEMRLPAPMVTESPEQTKVRAGNNYSQILVDAHSNKPFEVTKIIRGKEISHSMPMSYEELKACLISLADNGVKQTRPVVVPLPKSYSSDLLQATALVSYLWNEGGRAVVHTTRSSDPK